MSKPSTTPPPRSAETSFSPDVPQVGDNDLKFILAKMRVVGGLRGAHLLAGKKVLLPEKNKTS